MKLELKTLLPYIVLIATLAMTWGMWSEKINAVEVKADSVSEMQKDIAVIKNQIQTLQEDIQEIKALLKD